MRNNFTHSAKMNGRYTICQCNFLKSLSKNEILFRNVLFVFLLLGVSYLSTAQKSIVQFIITNNGMPYDGVPQVRNGSAYYGGYDVPSNPSPGSAPPDFPRERYEGAFVSNGPVDQTFDVSFNGIPVTFHFTMNEDGTVGYINEESVYPGCCSYFVNASIVVGNSKVMEACGDEEISFGGVGLSGRTVTRYVSDNMSGGYVPCNCASTSEFPTFGGEKYGKRFITYAVSGWAGEPELVSGPVYAIDYFPPGPTISATGSNPKCFEQSNGSITIALSNTASVVQSYFVTVTNLTKNLIRSQATYSKAEFPKTISVFEEGNYTIQVTNATAPYGTCFDPYTSTIPLDDPDEVVIEQTNFNIQPTKCKDIGMPGANINSGSITATASGGSETGFKYFLGTTALPSNVATGLSKGNYTFRAEDSKGCVSPIYPITINEPATAMSVSLSAKDYRGYNISCNGLSDGLIDASPSLAVLGYTFEWYSQPSGTLISGQSGQTLSGRGMGQYSVKLTDGNGCIAESTPINLSQPPVLDFTIDPSATLICAGGKIGLTANGTSTYLDAVNGQRLPLAYKWDLPGGETTASVIDKPAGNYGVTVTDRQGCNRYKTHEIVDPPGSTVTVAPLSNFNGSIISCHGEDDGILSATAVGAVEKYIWYKNNAVYRFGDDLSTIEGLEKGDYKVVIEYNNNKCTAEASYPVTEPQTVDAAISVTSSHHNQAISCSGASDANLKASVLNANLQQSPYTYKWSTGSDNSLLSGVKAGDYSVEIKDVNGCPGNSSITVDDPQPVVAVINNVSNYSTFGVSCVGKNDGSITAGGQGGNGVYSYSWSNGISTAANPSLTAGTYTVTVSDENGCHDAIHQVITSPPLLELDLGLFNDISCFGGNNGVISLQAKGGVINTYEFSKDNGTNWQPSATFSGLSVGNYTLMTRDINNCTQTISKTLIQPDEIEITFSGIQPALCSTLVGAATADVTGGVAGYTYEWRDSQNEKVGGNSPTLLGVKGDQYTVIVHDSHLCEATNSIGITSLDGAQSNYTEVPAKCFDSSDGSAFVNITSGDGPFAIRWPDGQTALQAVNLKRGAYNVLITDVRNCTVIQTVNVTSPDVLQLQQQNKIIPTCNGECDGELELVASGGVGGYSYSWNGQTVSQQTQLCAGSYPVVLKDGNECVLNQMIMLEQPDPVDIIVLNESRATCKDGCNGALEVGATGGNGGFTYTWETGGNTTLKNNLCPGSYTVSVVDSKGCSIQKNVILTNTPPIPLDLGGGVTVCVGQSYSLDAGSNWSGIKWKSNTGFVSEEQRVTIKEPGSYWLETVNDQGCIAQDTFLLETSTDLLKASFMISKEAMVGDTVVIIDVSWPLPESIEWSYPSSMEKVGDLGDIVFGRFYGAGTYTISLTAHLGECLGSVSKTITILEEQEENEGGRLGYEEYVKAFALHPNPNNGAFEVGVELIEEGAITLSIWSGTRGSLLYQVNKQDKQFYKLGVDLRPLAAGVYVVRLDHARGTKYLRFVVE